MKAVLSTIILPFLSLISADFQVLSHTQLSNYDNPDFSNILIDLETGSQGHSLEKRSYEGSGFETAYEASITVTSNDNEGSALASFDDDLLDSSTDTYQKAVLEAENIINQLMSDLVNKLGISSFKVVILGFREKNNANDSNKKRRRKRRNSSSDVEILFEVVFDQSEVASSNIDIDQTSVQSNLEKSIDEVEITEVSLAEEATVEEVQSSNSDNDDRCPACWIYHEESETCLPDQSKMHLFCGPTSMQLKLEMYHG